MDSGERMTAWQRIDEPVAMATRWRRRRVCTLSIGGHGVPVVLCDISGSGAKLECAHVPAIGSPVELRHPHAGSIGATVSALIDGGIEIAFDRQESAIAFALGAIAADMSLPS